ncbi:MAG: transporter ATP-binding protein [Aeromicrobium sp.]|nr:transporter ATP-binding protein [Aeromicrobium sp.]
MSDLDTAPAVTGAARGPAPGSAISVRGATRAFGAGPKAVKALGPLDLEIPEGQFLCLVGPSGCGKSTLVKVVAGLLEPSSGEVDVAVRSDGRAPIATVFQYYGIFPWKTVEGNVMFALSALGISKREAKQRCSEWLGRLGLGEFADAYPGTLSGGMRQRVAIARAMATEPEELLMDEPFAALDAQMREMLQETLLTVSQEGRRTVIFVTHSLEEAIILGDRVVTMSARPGRVVDDLIVPFARPRDTEIRGSAEFGRLRTQLWDNLRREVQVQMDSSSKSAGGQS